VLVVIAAAFTQPDGPEKMLLPAVRVVTNRLPAWLTAGRVTVIVPEPREVNAPDCTREGGGRSAATTSVAWALRLMHPLLPVTVRVELPPGVLVVAVTAQSR
jgi:hypothetical protein